jgi:hypothetical protein
VRRRRDGASLQAAAEAALTNAAALIERPGARWQRKPIDRIS